MSGYRHSEQSRAPEARQITEVAIERFDDVFEVDPRLMTAHVMQQVFPNWDTLRIVASRHDHLEWMHRHWAGTVVSAQALLDEIDD
ncbi:hypothetical protein DVA86_22785 [Streptomyces armeniacus]|uniref:Uncharacterized protein n=1 Tax=Streptomyces armeniacus TaxID=83291 RepID=A0A345XTT5_9ACTN|nr:hypothetical protein [Streptomyces armeniacus]AXK35051.1 hypothetical protein DVA86_22785 [Streptomyces armeniacus]